ncbi:hypothetical protein [Hymenobacter sp. BT491]|uniref:hypothetical protein n=1 Tax=Hymenobacter sp. BT491 TaxID=2766779 RepID=UPI0016535F3D|nr:hypothetical protein [Hymenobacter sp. BT491]MBC6991088.1 hypothetical protein [Hymenobacter sp. BT491]
MLSSPRLHETLYFRNPAGTILYHSAGYVRLSWNASSPQSAEVMGLYEHALTLLQRTAATKILSHHGQRQSLSLELQQALTQDWIPRAVRQAGLSYCAIVEGENPVQRLSVQAIVAQSATAPVFKRFRTLEEADLWLKTL